MPRKDYVPANPRPNLHSLGYERLAALLHGKMRGRRGAFYCLVMSSGTTYLRKTAEHRQVAFDPETLVGTYSKDTPINVIEDDLIERLRELSEIWRKVA